MIEQNPVPRNIAVLFDNKLNEVFIRMSNEINSKIPSHVVLNLVDTYPHLTLYSTIYDEKNLQQVEKRLQDLVRGLSAFSIRFVGKSTQVGTIFIDAEKSPELLNLHELLLERLRPLRTPFPETEIELPIYTEKQKQSKRQYGMWAVKEEYSPHVTVAVPIDSQRCEEALQLLPQGFIYTSEVNRISLVKQEGINGICKCTLRTFPFGNYRLNTNS